MSLILPSEATPADGRKALPRALETKGLQALNLSQSCCKAQVCHAQGMSLRLPSEATPADGKKTLPRALWTLKGLQALNLSQNCFKACPPGLSLLTGLQYLDLSHCKLMKVRAASPTVSALVADVRHLACAAQHMPSDVSTRGSESLTPHRSGASGACLALVTCGTHIRLNLSHKCCFADYKPADAPAQAAQAAAGRPAGRARGQHQPELLGRGEVHGHVAPGVSGQGPQKEARAWQAAPLH